MFRVIGIKFKFPMHLLKSRNESVMTLNESFQNNFDGSLFINSFIDRNVDKYSVKFDYTSRDERLSKICRMLKSEPKPKPNMFSCRKSIDPFSLVSLTARV